MAARAATLAEPRGHHRVLDALADVPAPGEDTPGEAGDDRPSVATRSGVDAGLTPRELEVLRLLVEGASNQEISRRLVIRPRGAAHHVRGIRHKTGSANRTRAAMNAVLHRWVETSD